jgi:Leucine-rich repeat (LRR) protein
MFIDWFKRKSNKIAGEYKRSFVTRFLLIFIPFVIALLFFFMYQSSNPLFYELTKDISFDFISAQWIFFTLGGLLLMYGFFYNSAMKIFMTLDVSTPRELSPELASKPGIFGNVMRIDTENLSGIILFTLLNALLIVLNALDLNHLCFNGGLPDGITHKAFVHDAIGVLILSILFAIAILLFYFRGTLNYYTGNKTIRFLAYAWIIQNVFMIFSTAYRNHLYISESGLSYKKIGVYVYLLLCVVGLVITFIKLYKIRTNWYLFRTNAAVIYYLLVLSCIPNWDVIITNYNIYKAVIEGKKLEKYFLVDLSFKNIPQLLKLPAHLASADDFQARDYYNSSRNVYYSNFNSALDQKIYSFMKSYRGGDWQSYCMEKERVFEEIIAMKDSVRELDLSAFGVQTLAPIYGLTELKYLDISQNGFDTLSELSNFPLLEHLSLRANYIKTIDELPANVNLKQLDLSQNKISDYFKLKNSPSLEDLNVSGNEISSISSMPHLDKLKTLDLSSNYLKSLKSLDKFPALENLSLRASFPQNCDSIYEAPNLKRLDISSNDLNMSLVHFFNRIEQFKTLDELDISNNNMLQTLSVITNNSTDLKGQGRTQAITAMFPLLKKLNAFSCKLSSVYPLFVYKTLEELNLSGNEISDINVLARLELLKSLDLSSNKISNIKALKDLKNLKVLNLSHNQISSCAELASLRSLTSLDLSGNNIQDISFLAGMPSLCRLSLKGNEIRNIEILKNLVQLEELTITIAEGIDTSFLYKLKNLKTLNINILSSKDVVMLTKAIPELKVNIVY